VADASGVAIGASLAVCGGLGWLLYFDAKDRAQPEPRGLLIAATALGALSTLLALGAYRAAPLLGAPDAPPIGGAPLFWYCLLVVGPVEEGAKFAVARAVVVRWRAFDEPVDGVVYAAAIAIGFAATENVLYAELLPASHQLARALASPLIHALFAALWGWGLARAVLSTPAGPARFAWQALPLVAAMLLHGLYDAALLVWNAAPAAAGLVLTMWIGLFAMLRRIRRQARVAARIGTPPPKECAAPIKPASSPSCAAPRARKDRELACAAECSEE
jgi:RsiW-degrading membrane proteinase PrsW (M82 family)